jgi:hypothetical protein
MKEIKKALSSTAAFLLLVSKHPGAISCFAEREPHLALTDLKV